VLYLSGVRIVDETPTPCGASMCRLPVYPLREHARAAGLPLADPVSAIQPRTWAINLTVWRTK
jgi:hypothetical protein